jgi:hypothetical protein
MLLMKQSLFFILCQLCLTALCQEEIEGPWTVECGVNPFTSSIKYPALNFRYISPRFRISTEDWTEEEERHPDKFKNGRLMMELMYTPPFRFFGSSFNLQYRFVKSGRLSIEAYGGPKLIFVTPSDYVINPGAEGTRKEAWYINFGLLFQFELGLIDPFVDIGKDRLATIGAEIDLHAIRKRIKKKTDTPYLKEK